MYSYVPDKLTGLLESLSAVLAAVCKATAVDVLLVIPGAGRKRPVGRKQRTLVYMKETCSIYQLAIVQAFDLLC